jgi:hypothetical protein
MVGLIAFGLTVGASSRAEAALIAYVCNDADCVGGDDQIVTDIDVNGVVTVLGSFFGWELVLNNSVSKPLLGSADAPQMDITFALITTDTASALWLYATDTDFTGVVNLALDIGGTIFNSTLTAAAYGGDSNDPLDLLPVLISLGPFSAPPIAYSGGATGGPVGNIVNPYSLTIGVAVPATTSAASITGDLSLSSIPEPTAALLLGLALTAGGWVARRRRT